MRIDPMFFRVKVKTERCGQGCKVVLEVIEAAVLTPEKFLADNNSPHVSEPIWSPDDIGKTFYYDTGIEFSIEVDEEFYLSHDVGDVMEFRLHEWHEKGKLEIM